MLQYEEYCFQYERLSLICNPVYHPLDVAHSIPAVMFKDKPYLKIPINIGIVNTLLGEYGSRSAIYYNDELLFAAKPFICHRIPTDKREVRL